MVSQLPLIARVLIPERSNNNRDTSRNFFIITGKKSNYLEFRHDKSTSLLIDGL
jgi:hypothetical protein